MVRRRLCGDYAEYAECSEFIVCIKQNDRADVTIAYNYYRPLKRDYFISVHDDTIRVSG